MSHKGLGRQERDVIEKGWWKRNLWLSDRGEYVAIYVDASTVYGAPLHRVYVMHGADTEPICIEERAL